jgi:hypothetical protein
MSKLKRKRKSLPLRTGQSPRFVVFSLKDFDINQGQSFEEWEKDQILSHLLTRLREISAHTIENALSKKIITLYDSFPTNTEFKHPKHIYRAVRWGTIHINGKIRICGYLEENIFYIVFLDKDHQFWISKKKHT